MRTTLFVLLITAAVAHAQPSRMKPPVRRVAPSVVMTLKATTSADNAEEPTHRPRRGTMPQRERDAVRAALAAKLKVPVTSLAKSVPGASLHKTKDPTGLDVGMSVTFSPTRWKIAFGTGGRAQSWVWGPRSVNSDHIYLRWDNAWYSAQVTLPTTVPSTPQAYTLECPVTSVLGLPPSVRLHTNLDSDTAEGTTPVIASDKKNGWIYASLVVPPKAYKKARFSLSGPAEGFDIIYDECELTRLQ